MTTFSVKAKVEQLGLDLQNITDEMAKDLVTAVASLAGSTYNKAIELASQKLHSTRQDYINALHLTQEKEGVWVVYLDPDMNHLEDGYCVLYTKGLNEPVVYTTKGWQKCIEIAEGDLVLTHDGTFQLVTSVYDEEAFVTLVHPDAKTQSHRILSLACPKCRRVHRGTEQQFYLKGKKCKCKTPEYVTVQYRASGGDKYLTVTPEHRVLTKRGWVNAGELTSGDFVSVPRINRCVYCQKPTTYLSTYCRRPAKCCYSSSSNSFNHLGTERLGELRRLALKTLGGLGGNKKKKGTSPEILFKKQLNECGIVGFEWQYPVTTDKLVKNGWRGMEQQKYWLDFFNPKLKINIEIDGKYWHRPEKDKMRDIYLGGLGIQVLRIDSGDVYNGKGMEQLQRLLANHAREYTFEWVKIKSIKRKAAANGTCFNRRFDLTVANNNSYVCQAFVVHNSSFPMLPKLAMGPKSKPYKDGSGRYVVIPMRKQMAPLNPSNPQQKDLASRLQALSKIRKWDKVRSGVSPKTGKYTTVERMVSGKDDPANLKGLTRVREYKSPTAKEPISSAYFTFRVASTKQDAGSHWFNSGFKGAQIFPELEKWAEFQLEQILNDFLL